MLRCYNSVDNYFSMKEKDIRVSVICTTYNHGKYIRDALEGFVNQKTDFNYEIIVHDDASTDNTASIIREYEKNYPDLIKPIYQKENQYSQDAGIMDNIIYPKVNGEYVALCEGDDYWINNNKLQLQADFLSRNPSYSAVTHNSFYYDESKDSKWIQYQQETDGKLDFKELIIDGGRCYHTSSIMFRKSYYLYPDSFKLKNIGDYPRSVYLSLVGDIYYFKEPMSVHRFNVEGSWTRKNGSVDKLIEIQSMKNQFLNAVDEYTKKEHHKYIRELQRSNEAEKRILTDDYWSYIIHYFDVFRKKPFGYQKYIIKQLLKSVLKGNKS